MGVPFGFIRHQLPVIAALGRTAAQAALQRLGRGARQARSGGPELPGPELTATLPPRDPALVEAFIRHLGGDPAAYTGVLPPWFFPQWGFPLLTRTLGDVPYPLLSLLNGGCRIEVRAPLPADEPLVARARLVGIDDDGRRALLHQTLVTGTASTPDALVVDFYPILPLKRDGDGKAKEKPTVPADAREIARWDLEQRAGLDFALLTGDFNPIHWLVPAARASGFKNVILHGFSTMGRTVEALVKSDLGGDPARLRTLDVRFKRPLVLPRSVGAYVAGDAISVGDGPGEVAYMTGTFTGI